MNKPTLKNNFQRTQFYIEEMLEQTNRMLGIHEYRTSLYLSKSTNKPLYYKFKIKTLLKKSNTPINHQQILYSTNRPNNYFKKLD